MRRLEVKACAAGSGPDRNTCNRIILIRICLLEHLDRACAGCVDPFPAGIEPQIVDAEDAGQLGNDRARVAVGHHKSPRLKRRREQPMSNLIECERMAVAVPGHFPLGHGAALAIDDSECLLIRKIHKNPGTLVFQLEGFRMAPNAKFFATLHHLPDQLPQ